MGRLDKLVAKMRRTPKQIGFDEARAVLRAMGYARADKSGESHQRWEGPGEPLTLAVPHGGRKHLPKYQIVRILAEYDTLNQEGNP